jgi:hypothetical protein
MRVIAAWILALGLVVAPAMAGTGGAADGKDAAKSNDGSAAKDTPGNTSAAPSSTDSTAKPAPANLVNEVQQLRELIEAQSRQLQTQTEQLKQQQEKMQAMERQLKTVNAAVESRTLMNEGADPALAINPATSSAMGYVASQDKKDEAPTAIHFKGITITPGGFFAAETVTRQHALSNDVNTDFKAIPMPGSSMAKVPETNFSGRQSQISTLIQGKLDNVTLRGYLEADFLSAGTTSTNTQSNSYTFRQRQLFAQAAFDSGWTITGGQMWSLVAETKKLLAPLSEAKPTTIDAQYTVGFSWARQYGFRVTKNFGDKFALGFSVEEPLGTFTAHGFAITQTTNLPTGTTGNAVLLSTATSNGNSLVGAAGDLSGLYNNQANYDFNPAPDFVFKAAWEPGWGHYEVFGVVSEFRTRIFPCASAANLALGPCPNSPTPTAVSAFGATNDSRTGGGFGANARAPLFNHHLDVGLHFLTGSGVARYGNTTLPDATLRGDGTFALLRSVQALGSLELHPTPKLDIYGYAGAEYVGRGQYPNVAGVANSTGYGLVTASNAGCGTETLPNGANSTVTSVNFTGGTGAPLKTGLSPTAYNGFQPGALGSCTADTRALIEGTLGFWYRFVQGPKGRLQAGLQYSYATRGTWRATSGGDPHGIENMFFTSFRYYLP